VIVGDGELRKPIEEMIVSRRLASHVTLAGWKNAAEIRQLMIESTALVMPSFAEGLPVVVMESLALGRAVLSTYVAGIPELVENGVSGMLVPAGDAAALADAMQRLLATPANELERLGENGRQRVCRFHDASTEAGRMAALFRRAISQEPVAVQQSVPPATEAPCPAAGSTAT
jgi:glycosyltransferase involved in cell wall biosynthesis